MHCFEKQYLQVYKNSNESIIYYDTKKETFCEYRNYTHRMGVIYYINLLAIPGVLLLGYLLQPFWIQLLSYIIFLKLFVIIIGIINFIITLFVANKYIIKKIGNQAKDVYIMPTKSKLIEEGSKWLGVQKIIYAWMLLFDIIMGMLSYFLDNLLLSILFIVLCVCCGVLGASINPIKRKKMYKDFERILQ